MRFVFLLATALAVSLVARAEPGCEGVLAYSFREINATILRLDRQLADSGPRAVRISNEQLKEFWIVAWPVLENWAREQERSVVELLTEYSAISELMMGERSLPISTKTREAVLKRHALALTGLEHLKRQRRNRIKTGPDFTAIENVYATVFDLGITAFNLEKAYLPAPTFNPLLPLSGEQILRIFESLQDSAFEHLLLWNEKRQSVVVADAPVTELGSHPTDQPSQTTSKETVRIDQLRELLRTGREAEANAPYEVLTPQARTLKVYFDPKMAKLYNGDRTSAYYMKRLLGKLVTAFPIQFISNRREVVELHGYMRGAHKRLFGCLDGDQFRLKMFMEITPSEVLRMVPARLCD